MNYEQRRTILYRAPKSGDTIKLQVGEFGRVWYKKRFLKQVLMNPVQGYLYCLAPKEANFRGLLPVHRLVALAWVPGKTKYKNIVNHIDSNKQNNFACNLEWVSKKTNNKTEHARMMKSKNATNVKHPNECIKATKGDEVHYYKNGRVAARAIGCSYPLIYLVLNPDHFAKTAKGWHLEWVPLESVKGQEVDGIKKEEK